MNKLTLEDVVPQFQPISLEEMDDVKLQDRTDTKFVFNVSALPAVLNFIAPDYRLLYVNSLWYNNYESLYYDTANLDLYTLHHNQKSNRYKVRFRRYVESKLYYFEIKFKNNKDRTIKHRQKVKQIDEALNEEKNRSFAMEHLNFSVTNLQPVVWVNYRRMTLVGKNNRERLTIDLDLTFIRNDQKIRIDNLVIAELKQPKTSVKSPFFKAMKKYGIRAGSISKYCYAIIHTIPTVKQNNFKSKLIAINKIIHGTT